MKTRQTLSCSRKSRPKLLLLALALGLCAGASAHYIFGFGIVDMKNQVKASIVWWNEQRLAYHRSSQGKLSAPSLPAFDSLDFPLDWPEFRGRHRDGIVRENLPSLPWPGEGPPIVWKQPVGGGQASFAAAAGRVYTIEQRGKREHVSCYAIETGQELWTHYYEAHFESGMGPPGPRATPTVANRSVFALGASGVLSRLNAATGEMVWQRNVLEDAAIGNLNWGMAGSPLVRGGKVYVAPGGPEASVIAYDARSGAPLWKSGNHAAGYSSPLIATLGGRELLIIFDGTGLSTYDPETGTALWHYPWETDFGVNAAQPIVVDDSHIFISSGYGRGCALLRVINHDGRLGIEGVWENRNLKLKYSSAVLSDGHIYGPDGAIFVCLDAKTGKRKWKGGRYGFGQVILVGQYLLILCENGDLALVEATPESYREISRVPALDGDTFSHPTIAGGKLLVRNHREMICFDLNSRN